jgi:hypothetical protein
LKRPLRYLLPVLIAAVAAFGLWPVQVVTLRLPEDANRLTLAVQLPVGQRVIWSYRHSVEQTRVEGVFEVHSDVEKPCLILVQTRYGSTGTGLPTEESSRTRREGDMLVVDEPGELQGLTFRIQQANQVILSAGVKTLPLQFLPSGSLVRMSVEIVPAWRYILWQTTGLAWPENKP